ncbi:MAG: efflux RND transporter periplasmic adaptor subunit [Xanthobacteraceae bacterium]
MTKRAIMVACASGLALAAAGCEKEAAKPEPVRPVLSIVVEQAPSGITSAVGTVEPRFKAELGFRMLDRLMARPVNVGDLVEEGQIVAAADPADLELAVRNANAELSRSRAQLANAAATEGRQRALITTDATTKATLDSAEQGRAAAHASVVRAQSNLAKAVEQLGYAQLKAEFAGVVTAVGAEVGQVVSPGQSVVTVARPDIKEAVVDIGPDFPVPLRIGLPFTVSLELLPKVHVEGEIREIAPEADPATRMRRVRIALNDPPPTFRLGSTVTASFGGDKPSILRVPASAVLTKDGEPFVWVVEGPGDTVSLHRIELSRDEGGMRVTSGLVAGTRVVTAGIHSLKQGQHVRIEQESNP